MRHAMIIIDHKQITVLFVNQIICAIVICHLDTPWFGLIAGSDGARTVTASNHLLNSSHGRSSVKSATAASSVANGPTGSPSGMQPGKQNQ